MRVEFLGTGGYRPNERRQTACVILPEIGLVFDAGTGFFRAAERIETPDVQIFLSHAHLDHVVGLTYFLVPLLTGKVERARVYGTEKTVAAVQEHLFAEPMFPIQPPYQYHELEPTISVGDGGILTHTPLNHPGRSTGYKIVWPDRSMAYVTDTIADGSYTDFVRGVDMLIHECYFSDDMVEWAEKTGHSTTSGVAQLARDAGVGRLILLHIDPERAGEDPIDLAMVRTVFPETEIAEDHMVIEF